MLYEIKSNFDGRVLFSLECGSLKLCLEAAVKAGANLTDAYLALADANLAGAYLADANLAGAYLAGANLTDAYLADANLAGAYLAGANLTDAYLADANLTGANLADANLTGANLAGANLTDAYLADAYLAGAYLAGANLADANLTGAKAVIDAGTPNGWRCVAWFNGAIQLRVGCRNKTLAEGREYWAGKEDRREVIAALDYIESVAKIRGWID